MIKKSVSLQKLNLRDHMTYCAQALFKSTSRCTVHKWCPHCPPWSSFVNKWFPPKLNATDGHQVTYQPFSLPFTTCISRWNCWDSNVVTQLNLTASLLKSHQGAATQSVCLWVQLMPGSNTLDCSLKLIKSQVPESVLENKQTRLAAVHNTVTNIVYIPLILFFWELLHSSVDSQKAPKVPVQLQRWGIVPQRSTGVTFITKK